MMAEGIELVSTRKIKLSDEILASLRKIFRAASINSKQLSKKVGLTSPQLLILKEIERGDKLTPGKIARAVSLSHATVTGIIGRLEKRDLLIRQRDRKDKRRVIVSITHLGKQMVRDTPALVQDLFIQNIDGLETWEQTMILSALQRLTAIMEFSAVDAKPPPDTRATENINTLPSENTYKS
jgi:DNA-binding MarR family transcriptional regulator